MASSPRDVAIDGGSSAGATPFPPNLALCQDSPAGKRAANPPAMGDLRGASPSMAIGVSIPSMNSVNSTIMVTADQADGSAPNDEFLLDVAKTFHEGRIPPSPYSKGISLSVCVLLRLDTHVPETRGGDSL